MELEGIINGTKPLDFSWNHDSHKDSPIPKMIPAGPSTAQLKEMIIVCEGLRDGLHGVPKYPTVSQMLQYVEIVQKIGIKVMTVGIYSGEGVVDITIKKLLKEMNDKFPGISPIVLSLATEESINWAADCAEINPKLQVIVFMGSSPSRMLAESWTKEYVLKKLAWAVNEAVSKHNLFVIGGTEHTTQTPPDFLKEIIKVEVGNGAKIFCIADTIGTSRPIGSFRIVRFVKETLKDLGAENVLVDWHGHRDTDNQMANALTAIAAGADRVHVVPWGIGERAGNTNMEGLMWNASQILAEHGFKSPWDLSRISRLLEIYIEITDNKRPSYGCLSENSQVTSLGIHTAAILKAEQLAVEAEKDGDQKLAKKLRQMARTVYTAVDSEQVGRKSEIRIGPWSGSSTVKLWALFEGLTTPTEEKIRLVLDSAKAIRRCLTTEEIRNILNSNNGF